MNSIDSKTTARDFRFNIFLNNLQNNHFDEIIEEALSKSIQDIEELKSKKVDLDEDFKIIVEQIFLEQKVKALSEMKIVYAYKIFENSIKHLLENMLPEFISTQGYRWEYLTNFLKKHNVFISQISSYTEMNQLRIVNNVIKHSEISNTADVPEFIGQKNISYLHILNFHKRVEDLKIDFFTDLRNKILLSLQDYESERIY